MRIVVGVARVMAVAIVLAVQGAGEATACPNCKEAVSATSSEAASMADGWENSRRRDGGFFLCIRIGRCDL